MWDSIVTFFKVFLFILLPAGLIIGFVGIKLRSKFYGHKKEDTIVCGSMLLLSCLLVFLLWVLFKIFS